MKNCEIEAPTMSAVMTSKKENNGINIDITLEADPEALKQLIENKIQMMLFQLRQPDGKVITLGIKKRN